MKKVERIYGRSPSLVAKHRGESSEYSIGSMSQLIYRTMQDRPSNENIIRGIL